MKTRVLPAGDAALLVDLDGVEEVLALTAALRAGASADIVDLVPAATTVLVLTSPGNDLAELGATVARIAEALDPGEDPAPDGEQHCARPQEPAVDVERRSSAGDAHDVLPPTSRGPRK